MMALQHVLAVALLGVACSTPREERELIRVHLRDLDFSLQETRARLATAEESLSTTRQELSQLRNEVDDARILVLVGGPPRRWHGGGVTCDGGKYLPGSWGASAHRALEQTGYCDPAKPTALVSQ